MAALASPCNPSSSLSYKATFVLLPLFVLLASQLSSTVIDPMGELYKAEGLDKNKTSTLPSSYVHPANTDTRLLPRIWKPFPVNETMCLPPPPKKYRFDKNTTTGFPLLPIYQRKKFDKREYYREGFLFNKPMKVGGSTASGVLLHMAKNLAERYQKDYAICDGIYDHTLGRKFRKRIPGRSYLMTLLRDPTRRSISYFYHIRVSREGMEPTLENFLRQEVYLRNYYVWKHSTENLQLGSNMASLNDTSYLELVNDILDNHDFMAVTERFDESIVVLKMLLGVPLGDMLYLKAKSNGGYDGGASKQGCVYIEPSNNLPRDIQEYIESDKWKEVVKWDDLLYQAANQSLDATIDALGRSKFEKQLQRFQEAQRVASERCGHTAIFPCSETGEHRKSWETNCLFRDAGCGFPCMDEIATELNLYNSNS
jgi:Galactose-3-O-sulfotransferase